MTKARVLSFKYAIEGIWTALKDQPNFVFHILATIVVILFGWFFQISTLEWIILTLTIGIVISIELTNTAIEEVVNSFTDEIHPSAKKAKDVAAGAVLVVSIMAVIVGLLIFLPYFI
ncbi:MAG: diacylglycerol kinase [uncultured bacterium]|uniref:Diacylglycerol kinase n=4 Tax=Candidatus Daviesiibacteriota TaxID=1752718 RepID=A0A0G0F3I7_9BACT|nr:MAG: diacylglycerol kinase [uncultured bacterium]KKQ08105.1 MAG: hypothetical protein US19_C0031G0005 [Candidatus Daviesbacteria bacterium GW2011_GWB1_36_5]KKQ16415.1 MAG: hypothetical protein US28_C0001G0005 [Candidatus Daviesbacteria bacterium GW2011_GWA1_36_8]OGE16700.1 MAG: hypothetical protein A2858_02590 [Candidatus Daviesbacteria bacterium RIFCSPHIGHO2_01_FULL_36_37]OGE34777.1 MAG: hypothetical protein A3E66_04110 [Candidatus Daviesbacteria bacterium RIFCSPHIGHO2_12_FULL_37_16]